MRVVWKYPVRIDHQGFVEIEMPVGARPLHIDEQRSQFGEGLTLWALVDPAAERETRRLRLLMTGQEVPATELGPYIGTVQAAANGIVGHLFEVAA